MAEAALGAAQWVVGKALAPVADGVLEAWAASSNFGLNIEALTTELLLVNATLEQAALKELGGPAMEKLLQRLRDSAHTAEDLMDELDYFRIHDELHGTYDAADQHGKGCICDLALRAHHTAKALGKQLASWCAYCFGANAGHPRQHVNCCAWQRGGQRSDGGSSSGPNTNQVVSGCMRKLGKLLPCSSSPHPHVGENGHINVQETPKIKFNRADFSQSMKDIVEKLQLMRNEFNKILIHCVPRTVPDIAQSRPTTTAQSAERNLYGRDHVMNNIIGDITKGQYCKKGLTVLPVVGPGGMGKTTLIQHIYRNQQVQNHFPIMIWICVSLNFNLNKVLEQIEIGTRPPEGRQESSATEELIKERLKSTRFLLVLDDIWRIPNGDDWEKLILILNQSQEKGCIILVTTRFQAIAEEVKTTGHSIELNGLEDAEFKKLFLAFIFDDGQCPSDCLYLLDTGYKIMGKLKGSPLAAKTVGRLLKTDLRWDHWKKVLNSKEWGKETDNNGIMLALKLSYDFLPFHLQQCFSYSALFPEDYRFKSHELISLWIGLDILTCSGQNQTFEDIGLSNLNELVIHGFFRAEETNDGLCYVMHDLLHDLALKVASHDCLSLRLLDVGSVEIQPSICHLSISTEDLGEYNEVSGENLKSELEELKKKLKVDHLQTLMLFGAMDESFAKIFGDFFGEANALRVLYLPDVYYVSNMMYPVESTLHNFSGLIHLRCLYLGTKRWLHLFLNISKFYHLRILDLGQCYGILDLPEDMINLAKLCHFYTPRDSELHSDICNVGKLKLLEELKVFRVNKKSKGFEPKQLMHLTKLRELGIYNLEKIHTKEKAAHAKLNEKNYLRRLTLEWDSKRSNVEPEVEAVVLEGLQPNEDLQVLCIRVHGGSTFPTWLGDKFAVEALRTLCLDGVSWEGFPFLGKVWDLHQVQELEIKDCPELLSVIPISWIERLRRVTMKHVKLLENFEYSKSSYGVTLRITGKRDLRRLDQVLVFDKKTCLEELRLERCPPLQLKDLLMLTSLKKLTVESSDALVGPLGGQADAEWKLPVEHITIEYLNGNSGKELTELLPHLPKLSNLKIWACENIKQLVAGVDMQQTTSAASAMEEDEITTEEEDCCSSHLIPLGGDGVLFFPPHLFDSLRELYIYGCPQLVLVDPPSLIPGGGWLQALRSLQRLTIIKTPKFLSTFSFSRHIFPSSLQFLVLCEVEGMGTLEPLSNLSSLTELTLNRCGEDLKHQGLQSLLSTGGQLNKLEVLDSPGFFSGWDPNPKRALDDVDGGEEQQTQLVSSTLQEFSTDDAAGLLAVPICRFLSSSLTILVLRELNGMERFSKEQEDALQLLAHLQELWFMGFENLQQLPAGLCNLTSLKILTIDGCPFVSSFPSDGLPKSLQELHMGGIGYNEELKQQCLGLVGTIPKIYIHGMIQG